MAYDNTNSGALFPNDKQKASHPDYRGTVNVNGVDYWISAWIKESGPGSKNPGTKFLSLAVTPKDDAAAVGRKVNRNSKDDFLSKNQDTINKHKQANTPSAPRKPEQNDYDSFDDDIPF